MIGRLRGKNWLALAVIVACAGPVRADGLVGNLWSSGTALERFEDVGGAQIQIDIDLEDFVRGRSGLVMQLRDKVRRILAQRRVGVSGGIEVLPLGLRIPIQQDADREKVLPDLRALAQPEGGAPDAKPILDMAVSPEGSIQLTYSDEAVRQSLSKAVDQTAEIIYRRIVAVTGKPPNLLKTAGDKSLLIQLPGCKNPEEVWASVGLRGGLEFRFFASLENTDIDKLPSKEGGASIAVERQVVVSGEDISEVSVTFSPTTNEPQVLFKLNARGAQRFGQATAQNVGRQLAIVFDGQIITAPNIMAPITGGLGVITGMFTTRTANDMVMQIRSGALPAKITLSSMQSGLLPIKIREKGKE